MNKKSIFIKGIRDGIPIGLGYMAVAFALGIAAKKAGIDAIEGFVMSALNMASAGEYVGITAIKECSPFIELAFLTLITNARYLLMSCAMSQKLSPSVSIWHRIFVGMGITDEIFGIGIAYEGYLEPVYTYGALAVAVPMWAGGTSLGIIAGELLPVNIVTALSSAIFGMFVAVVIPAARKDKAVMAVVLISFVVSYLASMVPFVTTMSESLRVIILTLIIAVLAAVIKPIKPEEEQGV